MSSADSAISPMNTPTSPPPPGPASPSRAISPEALASAVERRAASLTPTLTAAQQAAQHETRQKFRRLLDPGIMRPNARPQALETLKTLVTISDNLLKDPDNPKFQQFKPTNTLIKRTLVDRKGALEYAIELGFRPEVQNFQPYYVFHKRHMHELQTGNMILKEYLDIETQKQERIDLAKKNEKAAKEAAAERVKLAYMDDRKTKELRDQMEKEARVGRASAAARQAELAALEARATPEPTRDPMPGSGRALGAPTTTESEDPNEEDALLPDDTYDASSKKND